MSWLDSLTSAQKTVLALSVGVLLIGLWLGTDGWGAGQAAAQRADFSTPEFRGAKIMVHVVGAVARPGVYELPSGARGVDAINAAGGFLAGAVSDGVNLAEILDDGAQIRVEAGAAPEPAQVAAVPMVTPAVQPTPEVAPRTSAAPSAPAAAVASAQPATPTGAAQATAPPAPGVPPFMAGAQPQPPIRINVAGLEELQELPGVGEELAKSILYYRAAHGPFRAFSDLDGVDGIGPATIEKIRTRAILN